MTLNEMIRRCVEFAYGEDLAAQKHYVGVVVGELRGMNVDVIEKARGFFVPNNDYVKNVVGLEALAYDYGFYSHDGICLWNNTLVFPVSSIAGEYVGLAAFDPLNYSEAHSTLNFELGYYRYSRKDIYSHSYYFYGIPGVYEKAYKDGYVILTDGIFDTLSFASYGYNAVAALGSSISMQMLTQLNFIKKVIVAMDNDQAGLKMYRYLCKYLRNVCCLVQGETKDADDILKSGLSVKYRRKLDEIIESSVPLDKVLFTKRKFQKEQLV